MSIDIGKRARIANKDAPRKCCIHASRMWSDQGRIWPTRPWLGLRKALSPAHFRYKILLHEKRPSDALQAGNSVFRLQTEANKNTSALQLKKHACYTLSLVLLKTFTFIQAISNHTIPNLIASIPSCPSGQTGGWPLQFAGSLSSQHWKVTKPTQ